MSLDQAYEHLPPLRVWTETDLLNEVWSRMLWTSERIQRLNAINDNLGATVQRLGKQNADAHQKLAVCEGQLHISEELRKDLEAVNAKSTGYMEQANNYTDVDSDVRQQLSDTKLDLEASKQQLTQLLREHEHCHERASEATMLLEKRNEALDQENQALKARVQRLESAVDIERDEKQIQHAKIQELQKQFENICDYRDGYHMRHHEVQSEVEFLREQNNPRHVLGASWRAQSSSPISRPRRLYTPPNPYDLGEYSLLVDEEEEDDMDADDQLP